MKNKLNKRGFTLTELIVVIVIIGILAIVLIPTLTGYIKKANESADEQTVAGLNKLLLDAKIKEVEFNDILEVKEYLKDEMEYTGEYSLKIKGNYIWFDEEETQFVILGEEDLSSLKAADASYVLNDKLTSPEGLLKDSADGSILWLAGGNGDLLKVVEEIRNIGNNGESLKEFNSLDNAAIKELFTVFFDEYGFVGSKGTFIVESNGNVVSYDFEVHGQKEILKSSLIIDGKKLFHEDVIVKNITMINEELKEFGVELILSEDSYEVTVSMADGADILSTISSILKVMKILNDEGCVKGFIIPEQFKDLKNYNDAISEIYNSINANDGKVTEELEQFLRETVADRFGEDYEFDYLALSKLNEVDFEEVGFNEDGTVDLNATELIIPAVLISLGIEMVELEGKVVYSRVDYTESKLELLFAGNKVSLFGEIESEKYGDILVEYVFGFSFGN